MMRRPNNMPRFENEFIVNLGDEYDPKFEEKRTMVIRFGWLITGVFSALGLLAYTLVSSYFPQFWNSLWVLLLLGPVVSSIYVSYMTARMVYFFYPLAMIMFYVPLAFTYNIFGPLAWIFASLPIYYFIGYRVDSIKRIRK